MKFGDCIQVFTVSVRSQHKPKYHTVKLMMLHYCVNNHLHSHRVTQAIQSNRPNLRSISHMHLKHGFISASINTNTCAQHDHKKHFDELTDKHTVHLQTKQQLHTLYRYSIQFYLFRSHIWTWNNSCATLRFTMFI